MRVIGLFTAWNCKRWVNAAIHNHLKIVDELHCMIAAHNNHFEKIDDGTAKEAMDKWKDDDRVRFHKPEPGNIKECCDRTKCILLNQMRKVAKPKVDDIVMINDADEFYSDGAVAELKDKFGGTKWDMLEFDAMYFAVNMKWYMDQIELGRMFRVKSRKGFPDFHFKPTQRPIPRPLERQRVLRRNPVFHYSLLNPLKYKIIHWETERGMKPEKIKWVKEIYAKWAPNDHELCKKLAAENPTSGSAFYVNDDLNGPVQPPYMFHYVGKHPEEIEALGLPKIKDFRK